jgi:hypothetical protein
MSRGASIVIEIECELDEDWFVDWDELTSVQKAMFAVRHPHCEGSGKMAAYCDGCPFCTHFDVDRYDV